MTIPHLKDPGKRIVAGTFIATISKTRTSVKTFRVHPRNRKRGWGKWIYCQYLKKLQDEGFAEKVYRAAFRPKDELPPEEKKKEETESEFPRKVEGKIVEVTPLEDQISSKISWGYDTALLNKILEIDPNSLKRESPVRRAVNRLLRRKGVGKYDPGLLRAALVERLGTGGYPRELPERAEEVLVLKELMSKHTPDVTLHTTEGYNLVNIPSKKLAEFFDGRLDRGRSYYAVKIEDIGKPRKDGIQPTIQRIYGNEKHKLHELKPCTEVSWVNALYYVIDLAPRSRPLFWLYNRLNPLVSRAKK